MPDKARLLAQIENASESITPFWTLKTFIAANPLSGFEKQPFEQAVNSGCQLFGGNGLPTREMGQKALKEGKIKPEILKAVLEKHGQSGMFEPMSTHSTHIQKNVVKPSSPEASWTSKVNILMIKYLAAFLDEGQAQWEMPGREQGFYACWKALALYDSKLPGRDIIRDLPEQAIDALLVLIKDIDDSKRESFLRQHLAALPGWSGFVKWRSRNKNYLWQKSYPITLTQYLATRLAMARMTGDNGIVRCEPQNSQGSQEGLYWLEAWEESYRKNLTDKLWENRDKKEPVSRPAAQFVFCIDVRSEVFRRHLEQCGGYETYGFAGFFGVPIRHKAFGQHLLSDSCPVLLQPQFMTTDQPCCGQEENASKYLKNARTASGLWTMLQKLKNDIAAPFAMVEGTGAVFGLGMMVRTFIPASARAMLSRIKRLWLPDVKLEPTIAKSAESEMGLSLSERIFHAEAALKIMGLTKNFAPYVFLTGHGGETVNNPYASSLDCGACGGNHGGPNARIMASIFNEPAVRKGLKERGLNIPDDTIFVPALHNTTTDGLSILGDYKVPPHILRDLEKARSLANQERCKCFSTSNKPDMRAGDWAEVRPEWGLARNAAFLVGPRSMTKNLNLEGRTFLHSYNWEEDTDGKSLEIILTAPMIVAQWINTQYYFSTLDNAVYGSGSKTTHNVVGKIGVMQGNASDLMTGLALQSVMKKYGELYHEPLRLMTVVKAPLNRVASVVSANEILQTLFDNNWVALVAIDPETGKFLRYGQGKTWHNLYEEKAWNKKENTFGPSHYKEKNYNLNKSEYEKV